MRIEFLFFFAILFIIILVLGCIGKTEPQTCEDDSTADLCHSKNAISYAYGDNRDTAILECSQIDDTSTRNDCYTNVAKIFRDYTICYDVEGVFSLSSSSAQNHCIEQARAPEGIDAEQVFKSLCGSTYILLAVALYSLFH